MTVIAFALPRVGLELNFQMGMQIDDMDNIPGDFLGMHLFPLIHHDIFLFFYRTKNMDEWAKRTMLQYFDGVHVPIFIGKPEKSLYVEFRLPKFDLDGKKLQIQL